MCRPLVWLSVVVIALALALALSGPRPQADAFAALPVNERLALDSLAVDEIAALKLRHLLDSPAVDALVVGNSRPLPLSAADLGLPAATFFNAALTGESLRSSVLLLETLEAAGKAPRLALVSFDNAELQYYSNPLWPHAGVRWPALASDMAAGMTRSGVPLAEMVRMATRHLSTEAQLFARSLSFARVWRGLRVRLNQMAGNDDAYAPRTTATGYDRDGSRLPQIGQPYVPVAMPVRNRNVMPSYLDYDLERLAALAARGTRIVIFETPLHPGFEQAFRPTASAVAAATRRDLTTLCDRHRLECHLAPRLTETAQPWPDEGHPPAAVLAAMLHPILNPRTATP